VISVKKIKKIFFLKKLDNSIIKWYNVYIIKKKVRFSIMKGYIIKNGLNSSEEVFVDKEAAYSYCDELVNNGKKDAYVKEVQIVDEKRRNVTIAEDISKTLNFNIIIF
jgi:hypothetical protein